MDQNFILYWRNYVKSEGVVAGFHCTSCWVAFIVMAVMAVVFVVVIIVVLIVDVDVVIE